MYSSRPRILSHYCQMPLMHHFTLSKSYFMVESRWARAPMHARGVPRLSRRDLEADDLGTICVIDRTMKMRVRECSARRDVESFFTFPQLCSHNLIGFFLLQACCDQRVIVFCWHSEVYASTCAYSTSVWTAIACEFPSSRSATLRTSLGNYTTCHQSASSGH